MTVLRAGHSSLTGRRLPAKTPNFREAALAGGIRPFPRGQDRIMEPAKPGFKQLLILNLNKQQQVTDGMKVIGVDRMDQVLAILRDRPGRRGPRDANVGAERPAGSSFTCWDERDSRATNDCSAPFGPPPRNAAVT